ncbi:hypothetical protein NP233_g99 [Leucocoprinus birnbaumii]|uniref:HAT C-terminal dimerisation domain-containing protein n=1 Tax=Leucocoprinus birnbaumii TaxID=56174 RepID=A0AAD5W2L2_9AGAR|nr:hypothetical protein NP233_g99 [Leucocoprinus birnbaumii]
MPVPYAPYHQPANTILIINLPKTAYFMKQKWPKKWVDDAIDLVRKEWDKYCPQVTPMAAPTAKSSLFTNQLFDDLDGRHDTSMTDSLEEYLNSPPLPTVKDLIQWWTAMEVTGNPLAQMALNFLSSPAASTDIECAFSHGGLTVSKMHHSLSDESTCTSAVMGSWSDSPINIIPHEKILQVLRDKSKRSGKRKQKEREAVDDEAIIVD